MQSTSLKFWRFTALLLMALTLGMGFCHVMEMPARLSWDQALWVGTTVQGGLYRAFGTVGAAIVVATVASSAVVAYLLRGTGEFRAAAMSAGLFAVALLLWFAIVMPANLEMTKWLTTHPPEDWAATRLRWESGHAVNTALQFVGFCALLWVSLKSGAKET